jgi:small subunit ribosomal protein S2
MSLPTLRDLVDAGAQFGHQRSRTYPTAKRFIYTLRERVYVIDLEKTLTGLEQAAKAIEAIATQGKQIIFVGTKQQAIGPVQAAAEATGMSFINHRWLGGTLTNFDTLRRNIDKLDRLEQVSDSEQFEEFTKQERGRIKKQIAKLDKSFKGLRNLKKLPDAIVVIDVAHENIAIAEANALGIPVFALVDTDANPALVKHVIPGNDDSRKTIELVLNVLVEAIKAGQKLTPAVQAPATPAAEAVVIVDEVVEVKEQAPVVETAKPKAVTKKPIVAKKAKKAVAND